MKQGKSFKGRKAAGQRDRRYGSSRQANSRRKVHHLDGLYRQSRQAETKEFRDKVLPSLEVIYADEAIYALAAEIHDAPSQAGKAMGVVDTCMPATAIT